MDLKIQNYFVHGPTASGKSSFAVQLAKKISEKLLMLIACKYIKN